ncbi:MAG TPA: hypothetical protein DF614_02435 [Methylococcaceae bacterium]|nr:hypothetical protein [Methylococcaceae bacterium]
MSIQKECILRYRTEGHVRFQLPAALCQDTVAVSLKQKICAIEGVYRVTLYPRQGKLSIRFQETACQFSLLAEQLSGIIAQLEQTGALVPVAPKATVLKTLAKNVREKADNFALTRWVSAKTTEVKETLQATKIVTKLALKKPSAFVRDPEKAIIDFFNDILVLFLIRLHWEQITKLWLLNPFRYRYEWLATFYMFFLLIRSRKPK